MPQPSFAKRFLVTPGKKYSLSKADPDDTGDLSGRGGAARQLKKNVERLNELQSLLYAENRRGVLIVLQGMDTAGKDGTIRHVMTGVNPQGCRVVSFKVPAGEELKHDYLWRVHRAIPPYGEIGIFNRSHYEDVLVVRVHNLVPVQTWNERYEQINCFEKMLSENNYVILKFFLHISNDEQKKRLQARIDDPRKNWKISTGDFEERQYWDDYLSAFDDALTRCSTLWAPWHVIPSNRKWFRNLAVSEIIVETLEKMNMRYPEPAVDLNALKLT
jgi:PPK2 family polyphosphate:nucleotide phosphotransferase